MTPRRAHAGVDCPIGLYEKHDEEITRLAQAINRSSTAVEMVRAAYDLRQHARVLLKCRAYDDNNMNCRICRDLTVWREKTASVVEQMAAPPL
jgi:hypothetical protein